jgi:uncharacterized membrane protein
VRLSVDISNALFLRAKSAALSRGVSLSEFVAEGFEKSSVRLLPSGQNLWMKHFGKLKWLHKETKLIEKRIEEAFEHIDAEE